jgi:hypothetical protein
MSMMRSLPIGGVLLGLAMGTCIGFTGGCSDAAKQDGTQVQVDQKEQAQVQDAMKNFMLSKKQAKKAR